MVFVPRMYYKYDVHSFVISLRNGNQNMKFYEPLENCRSFEFMNSFKSP